MHVIISEIKFLYMGSILLTRDNSQIYPVALVALAGFCDVIYTDFHTHSHTHAYSMHAVHAHTHAHTHTHTHTHTTTQHTPEINFKVYNTGVSSKVIYMIKGDNSAYM